jgi:energy-converting hydrogenase Eha subunit F
MLERLERILPPLVIVGIIAEVASLGIQIAQYVNPPQVQCLPAPTVQTEVQSK